MRKTRILAFAGLMALSLIGSLLVLHLSPDGLLRVQATAQSTGLAYLPEDVSVVGHIDLQRALRSPLFTRLMATPDFQREFEKVVQETGLDPRRDVSEVLVGGKARSGEPLVFVRGTGLREKFQAFLARNPALESPTDTYKGFDLLQIRKGPQADRGPAFVFFDDGLVGIGELGLLKSAIDVRTGAAASVLSNMQFTGLLAHVNQSDTFWLASTDATTTLPPIKELQSLPINPSKLRQVALSGNLDMSVSGKIHGIFDSAESAKNLAAVGQGLLTFAKMGGGKEKTDETELLDGLNIESYQEQVILSVMIPYHLIDKLMMKDQKIPTIR